MSMWITDPSTKQVSVTLTLLVSGMAVATLKLLLSGMVIGGVQLGAFSGMDFAAVVGALGSLYWARRNANVGQPNA